MRHIFSFGLSFGFYFGFYFGSSPWKDALCLFTCFLTLSSLLLAYEILYDLIKLITRLSNISYKRVGVDAFGQIQPCYISHHNEHGRTGDQHCIKLLWQATPTSANSLSAGILTPTSRTRSDPSNRNGFPCFYFLFISCFCSIRLFLSFSCLSCFTYHIRKVTLRCMWPPRPKRDKVSLLSSRVALISPSKITWGFYDSILH